MKRGAKQCIRLGCLVVALFLAACSSLERAGLEKEPVDPEIHALVRSVESRMNQPYVLSVREEDAFYARVERLLRVKGDSEFAQALATEPPRTVSALRSFLSSDLLLESYPRTRAVLTSAPKIQWPAAIALARKKE